MNLGVLRIVSARCPYRRAGVSFEPNGAHSYGVALVERDGLPEDPFEAEKVLAALLSDPHLDVMIGETRDGPFVPLTLADFEPKGQPEPARGTIEIVGEHARMLAEQRRAQDAGPMGDEPPATETPPATEPPPAPATTAAAGEAAPAADAPPPVKPKAPETPKAITKPRAGSGSKK